MKTTPFTASVHYAALAGVMSKILAAESDHGTPPSVRITADDKEKKAVFDTKSGFTMSLVIGADLVLKSAGLAFKASPPNLDIVEKLLSVLNPPSDGMFEDVQPGQATEIGATYEDALLSPDHGVHLDDIESVALVDLLESIAKTSSHAGPLTDDNPLTGLLIALAEETKVGELAEAA